ncbi:ubiquinol-cytochrome C reductase hinge domain-containing protein [Trichoderma afarasin]|uniref:Cytochrome b-c1 complex subunit 6, mitochondrial n=1 Tax=Trichoderma breve TaxID=2034170 RepID=A0A9W9B8M9_9HYPO|nr:ubiquinol-cytochrome C reductase hinge protein domain-containing protein [Trichoderma breve]KAJ4858653.1 ubiquinol-cytochrome C reductase hinge protein domain-containing protein [Trichoderma breve]
MGIWDAFSEIVEAVTPWSVVEAEAPAEEPKEAPEASVEESKDEPEEEPAAEEEEEEEEEEDEEEIKDPKEELEEECKNSPQCSPAKHHFDECVERVHQQESEGEAKEDCVEEFFHLAHCATACAAPKLWSKLK